MATPPAPVQQAAPRPVAEARFERPQRGDSERGHEAPQRAAPPPPPAPAPAAAPAARPAPPPARGEDRKHGDDRDRKSDR
jgi:hypothetical protein